MRSEKIANFLRLAEKEETLASRRQRMTAGAFYGFLAGLTYGLTVGTVNALTFPTLPIRIDWGQSLLIGVVLGAVLTLIGALTGWYTERLAGVLIGAASIAVVGLGVQLLVVGVGAVGVIMLIVLAFPISVISLPVAFSLRWLSEHHLRALLIKKSPWKRYGLLAMLALGGLLLGIIPGSFERMGLREERSAVLVNDAIRGALTDPAQAKRLPVETMPGLKEHLDMPFQLWVTPSKISSVGFDIHVLFEDGFAMTCVTVAYTSTPYMRSCSPGLEINLQR